MKKKLPFFNLASVWRGGRIGMIVWGMMMGLLAVPIAAWGQHTVSSWTASTITLQTSDDLTRFRDYVNGINGYGPRTFSGQTIRIAPISGNTINWANSGNYIGGKINGTNRYFEGNFDGQGYIVSFSSISASSTDYVGFFGLTRNAIIKNLTVTGSYIDGKSNVGGLIGEAQGTLTIDNVHIKLTSVSDIYGGHWGGLVGQIWSKNTANIFNSSTIFTNWICLKIA